MTENIPHMPAIVEGRTVVTAETIERPPAERPTHDTVEAIGAWLLGDARRITSGLGAVDEYAWRLCAAGIPLLRVSIHVGTLHPQYLGAALIWWRDTGRSILVMIKHEITDLIPYEVNPVRRVREGGETLRRHLDVPDDQFDFEVLHELKERGGTDYLALPIGGVYGPSSYMVTYVADRPGGFTDAQIADLEKLNPRLSVLIDMHSQRHVAENVLKAYLGSHTGPRVLAGHIRRGTGEAVQAVLWSSDLRSFTRLSDHGPPDKVIAILDRAFDAQAHAISGHGGEILKFIGDGLLAIFPVDSEDAAKKAAAGAMAAAAEALEAVHALDHELPGEPALKMVIALHYGTVIYGNIGAADRLDFTVIGPAVNLLSRVETVAKSLNVHLAVSDDFARIYGQKLHSLGVHQLRGLDQPHELFAPAEA
ncbi:MAG TPA: adenylate/guanylate cyclase domain-containing protein [Xanthobacteraceae bacterium]|jgi:adenylate cyclase|nr:adenylate/guanylate cyclase domain-containing protein [Xanthobacteraceae bacterium]